MATAGRKLSWRDAVQWKKVRSGARGSVELVTPTKNGKFSPLIEEKANRAKVHFGKLGAPDMFEHSRQVLLAAGEGRLLDLHAAETDRFSLELADLILYHPLISENYLPNQCFSDHFVQRFLLHNRMRKLDSTPSDGLTGHVRLLNDPSNDLTDLLLVLYTRMADSMIVHDSVTTAAATRTREYSKTAMAGMFPVYTDWNQAKVQWSKSMLGILCAVADWAGQTDAYRLIRDNAMYSLYPEEYKKVVASLTKEFDALVNTQRAMWNIARQLSERLGLRVLVAYDYKTASKAFHLLGPDTVIMIMRPFKGPGGLLKKYIEKGVPPEKAHDISAFKVITDSVPNLYRAVSFLYNEAIRSAARNCGSPDVFINNPMDYVINPKPITLYQAVHIDTVVSDGNLVSFEGQACTLAMHLWADEGGASHDEYKGVLPLVNGQRKRLMAQLDSITSRSS